MDSDKPKPNEQGTVVIGLGNLLMRDDGIGIRVARELMRHPPEKSIKIYVYRELDLSLIEGLQGASRVVVVDALQSGKPPGTVSKYSIASKEESQFQLPSLHGLGLSDLFALAKYAGLLSCPVTLVGVEPKDWRPGKRMNREVVASIPKVLAEVTQELKRPVARSKPRV